MKAIKLLSLLCLVVILSLCIFGCSDSDDRDDRDDRCDHDWSDWELVKDGYCEDRKWERECDECGETKTKKGKDRDHEWDETIVDATCTSAGYIERECDECGKIETEITDSATGAHVQAFGLSFDSSSHWYECVNCYTHLYEEAHTIDTTGNCVFCGYYTDVTPEPDPDNPLAGIYDITMWVSERDDGYYSVAQQMQDQIDDFMAANPGIIINATIAGVAEADAAYYVTSDVASAPDIYCFSQYHLAGLVQANALAAPGGDIAAEIRANNDASSILSASVAGTLYAYPMTSENGYYLYYDKSIVKDPSSLEAIIADCEAACYSGKSNYLFRFNLQNAWYNASFFFGAGCHSEWIMDEDGKFIDVNDNFNSAQGLVAMKGMQKLTQSFIYDSDSDQFNNAAAIVTGLWNANAAEVYFGDNLGVCKLPSYTVDGYTYQLGSYSGGKLMGVKPQSDYKRGAVLQLLAHYLTSEKCQLERYEMWEWGPSNLNAQASEVIQSNVHLAALAEQNAHAVPQGMIDGGWWDLAAALGTGAGTATTDEELQGFLDDYETAINAIITGNDKAKFAWSVIGNICGTCWDTDFPMEKTSEGVWESDILDLVAGQEFKLRQGASWEMQVGADGQVKTPSIEPANIVVETTGSYVIRLEWDGVSDRATVMFIPA